MMTINLMELNTQALLTVAGAAAVCVLITQWLKQYLKDWRFTNLLAFGITFVLVEAAVVVTGQTTAEGIFQGFITALAGASLATFGYETIINLLGAAGVGPRK